MGQSVTFDQGTHKVLPRGLGAGACTRACTLHLHPPLQHPPLQPRRTSPRLSAACVLHPYRTPCCLVLQYKFIVDGQWRHDPNLTSMYDDQGNINNVLEVQVRWAVHAVQPQQKNHSSTATAAQHMHHVAAVAAVAACLPACVAVC